MNEFQRNFCVHVLDKLVKRPVCKFFLDVNPSSLTHSSFDMEMKRPVDIAGVRRKLNDGTYKSVNDWAADVRNIWTTTRPRNDTDGHYDRIAHELSNWFEKKWNEFPRSEQERWSQRLAKLVKMVAKIKERMPLAEELLPPITE